MTFQLKHSPGLRLIRALAAASVTAALVTGASAQEVNLRLAHGYPANSVEQEVLLQTADRIRERTDGALDIQVFSDLQLGTNADMVEQAVSGADLIVFVDASGAAEKGLPELGILSGPFLFETQEQAVKFGESELFDEWVEKLAQNGNLRILALNWFDQPRDIMGDRPFVEPSDLEGVKIRLPPLEAWLATFVPLGAVPTNLTFSETYGALEQENPRRMRWPP